MAERYPLPKWGLTMEDGKIVEWLVSVGDRVEQGQVIATVETEKIEVDLEAPAAGVVAELIVPEGDTADVGEDVIALDTEG